ncbi:MAG: class I SAM-dependent methyltransferase [Armatimonadetes bacterium]|nr:class I SAM-dependent methyltransferase [Armatimonadota bacterium]
MQNTVRENFDDLSKNWDEKPQRVLLANAVADAIIRQIPLNDQMDVLDYGCGTGLVILRLQPHVRSITGADNSQGMLSVFDEKVRAARIANAGTLLLDLEKDPVPDQRFHLIVSSTTMHHIADPAMLIGRFYEMLHPCGYLAIADLAPEGGEFHSDNTGVLHFGFEREEMKGFFQSAGFCDINDATTITTSKEVEGKGLKEFLVYLVTGQKRGIGSGGI